MRTLCSCSFVVVRFLLSFVCFTALCAVSFLVLPFRRCHVISVGSPESLLARVDDVEEAVLVLLPLVEVEHCGGDGGHGGLVHQQEEGLVRVQL